MEWSLFYGIILYHEFLVKSPQKASNWESLLPLLGYKKAMGTLQKMEPYKISSKPNIAYSC